MTDHPELRRTTQPSIMGGPLGDPGFCFFRSTVSHISVYITYQIENIYWYVFC